MSLISLKTPTIFYINLIITQTLTKFNSYEGDELTFQKLEKPIN